MIQNINPGFWHGKRVLITGHTGFKGSWMSLWLQKMGANLQGFALDPPTSPSLYTEARIGEGMSSKISDIRNYEDVFSIVKLFKPEIVIHMAAQPLVRHSYHAPVETYATNVMGTVHLLEAIRQVNTVRAILNITTDKCYENREWVWGYREEEAMGGFDPYSSSKGCSELVTSAYRRSYFLPNGPSMASARAGNVIGGGDWAKDRLIPDIIRSIENKEVALIRNPHAIRPWQHVLEPLSGYLLLIERLFEEGDKFAEGWNFGPNEEDARTVGWIADYFTKTWGNGAQWSFDNGDHPHESHYLKLDISKARNRLNYHPRWALADALDKIVEWQKARIEGQDLREVCIKQIEEFQNAQQVS